MKSQEATTQCNSETEKHALGEPVVAEKLGYGDREMGGRKLQFLELGDFKLEECIWVLHFFKNFKEGTLGRK